ncbi:ethanolamine ammonia-lyase subunit EutC [Paenibacillus xanthanilyticus]|uniref:Ethanolamine ammonia-lyase small subunit n=1 Tax=Paenibacillus xanthanilyticus TaxID=1783531 RepID=A0ABV8K374_9BACL
MTWQPKSAELLQRLQRSTPARIGVGRAGSRPTTAELLKLRLDHAAAVDAVYSEVPDELLKELGWFAVDTPSGDKETYLKRPDLGRKLMAEAEAMLRNRCTMRPQVQIVVSGGLSAQAIEANIRDIYPALLDSLRVLGLSWGTTFYVRNGRVACMDAIGELLQPEVMVLLIGERPGLASAESLSAYMGYRPRLGALESDRNVISNIHKRGTPPVEAGAHIGTVLQAMLDQRTSGTKLRV